MGLLLNFYSSINLKRLYGDWRRTRSERRVPQLLALCSYVLGNLGNAARLSGTNKGHGGKKNGKLIIHRYFLEACVTNGENPHERNHKRIADDPTKLAEISTKLEGDAVRRLALRSVP